MASDGTLAIPLQPCELGIPPGNYVAATQGGVSTSASLSITPGC